MAADKNQLSQWKPYRGMGVPALTNGPRMQMGIAFLAAPIIPWLVGIAAVGTTVVVGSVLLRKEYKAWKDSIGINLSNTPIAVLSGAAGAIALVVSGEMSGVGNVIAKSVGIAGIGGAIYALFTGNPAPQAESQDAQRQPLTVPPATVPTNVQPPMLPPGALARGFTINLLPSQPNTGGTTRQEWMDQDYELVIRNELDRKYSFYVGISIYDEGSRLLWKSPPVDAVYGRRLVSVDPGKDVDAILRTDLKLTIPISVAVQADLFRNRDDAQPFMSSDAISVKYSFIG